VSIFLKDDISDERAPALGAHALRADRAVSSPLIHSTNDQAWRVPSDVSKDPPTWWPRPSRTPLPRVLNLRAVGGSEAVQQVALEYAGKDGIE